MTDQRLIKVARCKGCGEPFAGHIVPFDRPDENLTMSQRLAEYDTVMDIYDRYDRYAFEGHAVTVERNSDNLRLGCKCK